jgi:hypothetical protein
MAVPDSAGCRTGLIMHQPDPMRLSIKYRLPGCVVFPGARLKSALEEPLTPRPAAAAAASSVTVWTIAFGNFLGLCCFSLFAGITSVCSACFLAGV